MSSQKIILHVEVILRSLPGVTIRTDLIKQKLPSYLYHRHLSYPLHSEVEGFDDFEHHEWIDKIYFREVEGAHQSETKHVDCTDVDLKVHVVRGVSTSGPVPGEDEMVVETPSQHIMQVRNLPAVKNGDRDFESLVFQDDLHRALLHLIVGTDKCSTVLLHGPPGTGKTSLCRAIVDKAALRLARTYATAKIIEVNSPALLAESLGRSQAQVSSIFDQIRALADDDLTLHFVLFDEVESIANDRAMELNKGHIEAMRATNQLLAALDDLRDRSNVMVFCTSNLIQALDPAFLSRMHVIKALGLPGTEARYHILRQSMQDLVRAGKIDANSNTPPALTDYQPSEEYDLAYRAYKIASLDPPPPTKFYKALIAKNDPIVDFTQAKSVMGAGMSCLTTDTMLLAMMSEGLDGRHLTSLPVSALGMLGGTLILREHACDAIHNALKQVLVQMRS